MVNILPRCILQHKQRFRGMGFFNHTHYVTILLEGINKTNKTHIEVEKINTFQKGNCYKISMTSETLELIREFQINYKFSLDDSDIPKDNIFDKII